MTVTQPTDHVEADTRCPRCDTVTTWRGTRHTPGDSTDYSSGIDCCKDEEQD